MLGSSGKWSFGVLERRSRSSQVVCLVNGQRAVERSRVHLIGVSGRIVTV